MDKNISYLVDRNVCPGVNVRVQIKIFIKDTWNNKRKLSFILLYGFNYLKSKCWGRGFFWENIIVHENRERKTERANKKTKNQIVQHVSQIPTKTWRSLINRRLYNLSVHSIVVLPNVTKKRTSIRCHGLRYNLTVKIFDVGVRRQKRHDTSQKTGQKKHNVCWLLSKYSIT